MDISLHRIMTGITSNSDVLLELSDTERTKLQNVLAEIMFDIHKVCEKYGIKYALGGGSALGAVRHKGFIPWDDDLDFSMLREDYNKFKSIFDKELSPKYKMEAPNYGNEDAKMAFARIYKKGTELIEIENVNTPYAKGFFVDLFIYENVSNNKLVQRFDAFVSDFMKGVGTSMIYYRYNNMYMEKYFSATFSSKLYYNMRRALGFFFSFVSHRTWLNWYDSFISRHQISGLITAPAGRKLYKGEIIPRKYWTDVHLTEFEGKNFYISDYVSDYLRNLYGEDYMQLPPLNKREKHFYLKIDFGEDSVI